MRADYFSKCCVLPVLFFKSSLTATALHSPAPSCHSLFHFYLTPAPRCVLARKTRARHSVARLLMESRTHEYATL
jgi:hypothetical protein